jgi:hypothetical protein
MIEGKELEGKIGDVGEYFVDVDDHGVVQIGMTIKVDLIAEAKKLAAKTGTPLDDQALAWLALIMGRG